ncbi:hypothetical protein [Diaphorobacter caeni]|uniref:hypothetical protein n=1 Tax=Diaphorobacter caeni TaxID=2784387 RepID=UPI001890753F|nr:hypothetical protein [Diaphorobacter caeni]MBF5006022.1 hypothetical protein [Diaphorobacter caeni]
MTSIIHIALAQDGTVVAHFINDEDAAQFCRAKDLTHVPFNLRNRDGAPAPLVGTTYRA